MPQREYRGRQDLPRPSLYHQVSHGCAQVTVQLTEMVDLDEHNNEGLEPDIQQAVDQRNVHVETETDRFCERQSEGSD